MNSFLTKISERPLKFQILVEKGQSPVGQCNDDCWSESLKPANNLEPPRVVENPRDRSMPTGWAGQGCMVLTSGLCSVG